MTVTAGIQAIGEGVKALFESFSTLKEKQSETEVIKIMKKSMKAINLAERIFKIVIPYLDSFSEKDKKRIKKLLDRFLKYN